MQRRGDEARRQGDEFVGRPRQQIDEPLLVFRSHAEDVDQRDHLP
jgi:hypothetical protein